MSAIHESTAEIVEKPLSRAELAERFRDVCADPRFANVPGKIELDVWGRMVISPANNRQGLVQLEVGYRLRSLGGKGLVETSIATSAGVLVADVVWASTDFMARHGIETPFMSAPEICIEIASPSNSIKELREKVAAYLDAGAVEAWVMYPQSKRIEFFGQTGKLATTVFAVDLEGVFD